jgi:NADH-quinone oxidoreductase subunit A
MLSEFYPLFLQVIMAGGLALTLLLAARYLGPRRPNRIKQGVYESGMDPVGSAHERFSVKFYLVAMIFIVFDVEVVFLYPWAVSYKEFLASGAGLGVLGVMGFFVIILALGLLYDIKKGGLDFDDTRRPVLRADSGQPGRLPEATTSRVSASDVTGRVLEPVVNP